MYNQASQKPKLAPRGGIRRKAVAVPQGGLVRTGYLDSGNLLPLVCRPAVDDLDLADWAGNNLEFVEAELLRHGAILFRGFNVDSPPVFERFAIAVCPELFDENGEHPRETISGKVYTPVFYPPDKQLLWHNENSFNHSWPTRVFFGCVRPADEGGETPLVDSRRVFEMIDPQIRKRFADRQIMYVRNYGERMGLSWQKVFLTRDRTEVEHRCRAARMQFEWKSRDRLMTSSVRPAIVKHPGSGREVWFNQAQHWHVSCLDAETRRVITESFGREDLPRNCYYGDGSPIEDSVMDEILCAYRELESSFPWQRGDVVVLDNLLTAHGRNPYSGVRTMLVALGAMKSYDEVQWPAGE
ncbi:MAG: hypothetical protein QOG23_5706 [Blastocatellia bacterium]|jgi:alpha-ketoglutarate-dependent taurine dioxygenase|nr:hypothetical protein [Blastocatellia bacterium]